jgi:hypothetical protein
MIYEIVFYGGDGLPDTVLIVRASDYRAALDLLVNHPKCHGRALPTPDVVYEIGTDNSPYADTPNILFGPFTERQAWDYGWRRWQRRAFHDGVQTHEWEECSSDEHTD